MAKKQIRRTQTTAGGPINYKRWDDAKITSYTVPFIKEKAIKLTNAGRATGAVLSTNLLDSLADNAMRAGVPVRTAIGISTKETTLGNPTDTKSAWNLSSGIRREFNGKYPGTHQHINPGRDLNERELVINYHKGHQSDTDTQGKSVIQEALEFYKQHPDKYNTNQSDYQNLVNIIGEEVMKSPEVQKWYREWEKSKAKIFRPEPYKINTNIQNTAQEFIPHKKQGGKMNILEFLKNGSGIHIKKKNRGKFTSYCGGKVTDECIQKGKNSSNPAIRKRATFAANARKWKHKEGGIIKAGDGLSTSLLGLLPGVGTYQDYKEFEKNPNWKTGLSLGVSALGDAAMLTGAGALIKGISAVNKARKILGTAGKAANVARQQVWNQASKLKRESDAVNSLTLMGAPTNKIIERQASKNLAKKSYEKALKNDEAALKVYQTAANNPAFNFNSSQFAPLIYTNPGFHTVSQAIKHKKGGIIKASNGSNIFGKVGNFFKNNKLGQSVLSTGINLGLNSLINSANKNVISNEAEISKANIEKNAADEKLNNSAKAEEMVRNTLAQLYDKDNPNAFGGDIVKGQLKQKFLNQLNAPIDQKLATQKAQIDFQANQLKNQYNIGSLGGLSTDILNAFSNNKNSSSNNPSSGSYLSNYVNTQYKNYGTFNSDGSMNLGGGLGTFSTTGGYKPRQYQMKTYTPQLKFSV